MTGEDTDRILADFGFEADEVAALRESGVVA
jgi:crotonobetainyl-CoA:carnitine CoA-transferase CaiB-like acyl-CoA transferase